MNAQTPIILNAQIVSDSTQSDLTIDGEIVSSPISARQHKHYQGKLRFLSSIHREIASQLDASRKARYESFFMPCDKYLPETEDACNILSLYLDNA